MNILSITRDASNILHEPLLDWITSPAINRGVNHARYWAINTDTDIDNVHQDHEVDKLAKLLMMAKLNDYQTLMIIKDGQTRSQPENPTDSNGGS